MTRSAAAVLVTALMLAAPTASSAQVVAGAEDAGNLIVVSPDGRRTVIDDRDVSRLERHIVRVAFHDGEPLLYEGPLLGHLLGVAGLRADSLRGAALTRRVVLTAADGYQVVLSLGEVDPGLADRTFVLADRVDGGPLPGGEAPYRLVIDGDPRHARWIRQVVEIAVAEEETR